LSGRCAGSLTWYAGREQEGCKYYANEETISFHRSFLSERKQVDADSLIVSQIKKPVSEGETGWF